MTEINVTFAPGCFDEFEGTQEELDALIAEIMQLAKSGDLFDESQVVNLEELDEDEEDRLLATLEKSQRILH